jgi:hypothetical protein
MPELYGNPQVSYLNQSFQSGIAAIADPAGEKRAMLPHLPGRYKRLKVPYFLFENAAQSCFHSSFCITIHLLTRRPLHRGEKVCDATGS